MPEQYEVEMIRHVTQKITVVVEAESLNQAENRAVDLMIDESKWKTEEVTNIFARRVKLCEEKQFRVYMRFRQESFYTIIPGKTKNEVLQKLFDIVNHEGGAVIYSVELASSSELEDMRTLSIGWKKLQ